MSYITKNKYNVLPKPEYVYETKVEAALIIKIQIYKLGCFNKVNTYSIF